MHVRNHNLRRGFWLSSTLTRAVKCTYVFNCFAFLTRCKYEGVVVCQSLWAVLNVSQHYFISSLKHFWERMLHLLLKYHGKLDFYLFWNVL
jgi:hypothetical protein